MKKGFTLIELLGVIALLGVLATLSIPIIDNSINQGRNNLNSVQKNQIIKGAKDYYSQHLSELPKSDGEKKEITLSKLKEEGYLPTNIKNLENDEDFVDETKVVVTKNHGTFTYEIE